MGTIVSTSTSSGITLTSTSSNPVTVTGTINVTSGYGLYGKSGGGSNSWTVTNSGTIESTANHAVVFGHAGSTVTNGVFTNSGYVFGTGASVAYGMGIFGP